MNLSRLKAKNQVTLPSEIVKKLNLKPQELFQVDIWEKNIVLIPVEVRPKYSQKELRAVAKIVRKNKPGAKTLKPGPEFENYIAGIK